MCARNIKKERERKRKTENAVGREERGRTREEDLSFSGCLFFIHSVHRAVKK